MAKNKGFFVFDVESSGLYNKKYVAYNKNQAWIVQLGGIITTSRLEVIDTFSYIMKPPFEGATISKEAFEAHGITLERCVSKGIPQSKLHSVLKPVFDGKVRLVGHNVNFDTKFLHRFPKTTEERDNLITAHRESICTMRGSVDYCKLAPTEKMAKFKDWKNGTYKMPKLVELYQILFDKPFVGAHDALNDANATLKCLKELVRLKVIKL